MKKISIVCDKPEGSEKNAIKTIVIFEDGENPIVINYTGIKDLLTVVKYTEKNGYDILKDGIKQAIDDGYVNIMLHSNVKAREELEADILKAFVENKPLDKTEETTKVEEPPKEEEKSSPKDTSKEEYSLFLKLSIERDKLLKGKDSLTMKDVERIIAINEKIKELRAKNERVAKVEEAREKVAKAYKKYSSFKDKTTKEAVLAERELVDVMTEFNALLEKYKNEIKEEMTSTEEKKETTKVETPEEKKKVKEPEPTKTSTVDDSKRPPVSIDLGSFIDDFESITGSKSEETKEEEKTTTTVEEDKKLSPVSAVEEMMKDRKEGIEGLNTSEKQFYRYLELNFRRRQLLRAISADPLDNDSKRELATIDRQIEELEKVNKDIQEIEDSRRALIKSINKRNSLVAINKNSKEAKAAIEEVEKNKEKYNELFTSKRDTIYKGAREVTESEEKKKLKRKVTRKVEDLSKSTEGASGTTDSSAVVLPRGVAPTVTSSVTPTPTVTPTPPVPPRVTPSPSPIVVPTPVRTAVPSVPKDARPVGSLTSSSGAPVVTGATPVEPTAVVESFTIPIAESERPVESTPIVVPTMVSSESTGPVVVPTPSVPRATVITEAVYPTPISPVLSIEEVHDGTPTASATPTPVAPAPVVTPATVPTAGTPATPAPVVSGATTPATPTPVPVVSAVPTPVAVPTGSTPTPTVVAAPGSVTPVEAVLPAAPAAVLTAEEASVKNAVKNKFKLVKDKIAKAFKGDIPPADGSVNVTYTDGGKEKVVKVKTRSGPIKAVLEYLLGFAFGIGLLIGADRVINKAKTTYRKVVKKPVKKQVVTETKAPTTATKTTTTTQQAATPQQQAQVDAIKDVNVKNVVTRYFSAHGVSDSTRAFITRPEVLEFLSGYKNEDQLYEVLDALCYGYEANILTTKEGNFRMNADGTNYLTTFTHDFLCAKAVVNGYSASGMMRLFGGANVSENELMTGFERFCDTIRIYGMNAREPLPFKYLLNGNQKAMTAMNLLQNKLITVNVNRDRGTLNSGITDDFIGTTYDLFTSGDHYFSAGAKTVATALVDSYVIMQANVSGGNALYLHNAHNGAPAGTYFGNVSGHTAIVYPNKTYTGLYYMYESGTPSYLSASEISHVENVKGLLREALTTMASMKGSVEEQAKQNLLRATYNNRLIEVTSRIRMNEFSDADFDQLAIDYPTLADDIDLYRYARGNKESVYVPLGTTSEGFDRLLGIEHRPTNNVTALLNNRRSTASTASYTATTVTDRRTETVKTTATDTTATRETTTREEVTKAEMTPEERARVEAEERARAEAERTRIEEKTAELKRLALEGKSQKELEALAKKYGITLSPTFAEDTRKTEAERLAGEKLKEIERKATEEKNRLAREEAERRKAAEDAEAAKELERMGYYIDASEGLPTSEDDIDPIVTPVETRVVDSSAYDRGPAVVDHTDSTRVDTEIGETPYSGAATRKNQLETMKRILLETPIDGEELITNTDTNILEKRMG